MGVPCVYHGESLGLSMVGLSLLMLLGSAQAGVLAEGLESARAKIEAGEPAGVLDALKGLEDRAAEAVELVPATELGRVGMYRGMAAYLEDPEDDAALEHWRAAFTLSPDLQWEPSPDLGEGQAVFEAIRREVTSRPWLDPSPKVLPKDTLLFIDGLPLSKVDEVVEGEHFVQARCPDGVIRGQWTDLGRRFSWADVCTGGPQPLVAFSAPTVQARPRLAVGAGSLVLSGLLYAVASQMEAAYLDPTNPDISTLDELDALRAATNRLAMVSGAVGLVGTGLTASAFMRVSF
jgi:hypothetical protein